MNLEELHEKLSDDVEDSLEELRAREAETERKFPGYPPYVSEDVLQKIEWAVDREVRETMAFLEEMFGRAPVKAAGYKTFSREVRVILGRLAKSVAHQAAGSLALESAKQATQASHNMLMGTLAGIALGSRDNTQTEERGETDAGTEA